MLVLLPEAPRLPRDLVGGIVADVLDDGCDGGREVGIDILERGERHGADTVIGIDGLDAAADAVLIRDTHTSGALPNEHDLRVVANGGAQLLLERAGNLIHAADGLKHGGLPVDDVFGEQAIPQIGVEQRVHGQRIARLTGLGPGAGQHFVAGALRAGKFAVRFEVAIFREELEHALLVLGVEFLIERALADALRQKLGDVAARVVDHLALLDRLAVIELIALQERGA